MAVVGHWVVSFLLSYLIPDVSVTLLCKLVMLSDALCGLLLVLGVERVGVFANFMDTVPAGTEKLIEEWQKAGLWDKKLDPTAGKGHFGGWVPCCFPFYADLSYSHSAELMALLSLPVGAYCALRWGYSVRHLLAIFVAMVSHPLIDMIFHDAYVRMGTRTETRVSLELWQMEWNAPFTFAMETACAYGCYRLWALSRVPIKPDAETAKTLDWCRRTFWSMAITNNMFTFYVVTPTMVWLFYHIKPQWGFAADTEWSYILVALTMWSWTGALYPLYRLESLTAPKISQDSSSSDEDSSTSEEDAAYVNLKV